MLVRPSHVRIAVLLLLQNRVEFCPHIHSCFQLAISYLFVSHNFKACKRWIDMDEPFERDSYYGFLSNVDWHAVAIFYVYI